ncbi:MAG: hypothetical protein UMU76_08065 [Prosthecochloris sp.]|nr:hypothetical protein [Prosthecochloris sp.]
MDEKQAYLRVAERSIDASDELVKKDHQEASAFFSYHAFESLGGAVCSHVGLRYSLSHRAKISQFLAAAKTIGIKHGVKRVSIIMASIDRNMCLYPKKELGNHHSIPENRLNVSDAKDINKRIKGVNKVVRRAINT